MIDIEYVHPASQYNGKSGFLFIHT